jgi:UDPglucose 6-dehydrogenase
MYIAAEAGYDFHMLEGVARVNEEQFERMVAKVVAALGGPLQGRRIAVWGLTFKANTDDLRDSPAIAVVERMLAAGAEIVAYDPAVPPERSGHPSLTGVEVALDPYEAVTGAEALAVLTEWDAFRWFDFAKVADLMASRHVIDTRNLLEPAELRRHGFTYQGVGRS